MFRTLPGPVRVRYEGFYCIVISYGCISHIGASEGATAGLTVTPLAVKVDSLNNHNMMLRRLESRTLTYLLTGHWPLNYNLQKWCPAAFNVCRLCKKQSTHTAHWKRTLCVIVKLMHRSGGNTLADPFGACRVKLHFPKSGRSITLLLIFTV